MFDQWRWNRLGAHFLRFAGQHETPRFCWPTSNTRKMFLLPEAVTRLLRLITHLFSFLANGVDVCSTSHVFYMLQSHLPSFCPISVTFSINCCLQMPSNELLQCLVCCQRRTNKLFSSSPSVGLNLRNTSLKQRVHFPQSNLTSNQNECFARSPF